MNRKEEKENGEIRVIISQCDGSGGPASGCRLAKLEVQDRTQAVIYAFKQSLVNKEGIAP
jgi:hypothetical protein